MKIAIAQMNTRPGDFAATVERMLAYGRRAQALGADLLVFPTPAFMGIDPGALSEDDAYVVDAIEAMGRLASGLAVTSLVPFVFDAGGVPAPDVALIRAGSAVPLSLASAIGSGALSDLGRMVGEADSHDPDVVDEMADELSQLAATAGPLCVSVAGVDVGIALGRDDLDAFVEGDASVDVVCYLPTDGYDTDDESSCLAPSVSDGCFVDEAERADAWIVAANAVGGYEDAVFCGGSFVLAPWGELAGVAPLCAEDLLVCDVDVLSEGPLSEPCEQPSYDRTKILWNACALATRDQVEKRGLAGVAVVLDGTLASSATAALAVDAVGPVRVSALVCARDDDALADARALARNLRIRDVDELSARDLARAADLLGGEGDSSELEAGLVEARLGMLARSARLLALSSADKTMLAVGAAEGVPAPPARADAFAPFGDVYRSDLARLARHRNTMSPSIPAGSLSRLCVPRDLGLEKLAGRRELMLSELDAALLLHVERGAGLDEMAAGHLGRTRAERVLGRLREGEASRRQGPAYPVVSARSLGEAFCPVADAWQDLGRLGETGESAHDELADAMRGMAGMLAGLQGASAASPSAKQEGSHADGQAPEEGPSDEHVSEVLGYLQDISAGRRLRRAGAGPDGGDQGSDGPWPTGMFSDN